MGLFDFLFGTPSENPMTKNYIGKHGEFSKNDEDRDICEDMFSMHAVDPDTDLSDHYDWDNLLNFDSVEDPDEDLDDF